MLDEILTVQDRWTLGFREIQCEIQKLLQHICSRVFNLGLISF